MVNVRVGEDEVLHLLGIVAPVLPAALFHLFAALKEPTIHN